VNLSHFERYSDSYFTAADATYYSSSDEEEPRKEQHHKGVLSNIADMENFLVGSSAFRSLLTSLKVLRRKLVSPAWIGSSIHNELVRRVAAIRALPCSSPHTRRIMSIFNSLPLPSGTTRMEWTCRCGHTSYDDFNAKSEVVRKLAEKMVRSGSVIRATTTGQATSKLADAFNSLRNSGIAFYRRLCVTQGQSVNSSSEGIAETAIQPDMQRPPSDYPIYKFVALCLQIRTFTPSLVHLQLYPSSEDGCVVNSDQELFRQLRKTYSKTCKRRIGSKLCGIYFVKVGYSILCLWRIGLMALNF
jgi:hypothetical protein